MLHDLLLLYTRLPAIPLDVAQVTVLLFYGLYIMRRLPSLDASARTDRTPLSSMQ
jgi:hypothetical protein